MTSTGNGATLLNELSQNDVLLGRGTGPNEHIGNIRYRALVRDVIRAEGMPILDGKTKSELASKIVNTVKARNGRFVKKVSTPKGKGEVYQEVPNVVALDKTKQSFRHQIRAVAPAARAQFLVSQGIHHQQQKDYGVAPVAPAQVVSSSMGVTLADLGSFRQSHIRQALGGIVPSVGLLTDPAKLLDAQMDKEANALNLLLTQSHLASILGGGGLQPNTANLLHPQIRPALVSARFAPIAPPSLGQYPIMSDTRSAALLLDSALNEVLRGPPTIFR